MFENIKADIARLSPSGKASFRSLIAGLLSQGFQAILVYRFFNWLHRNGIPGQPFRFIVERIIEITTGISIPAQCRIGRGLRIFHFGGIIFHPTAILGENCTVYHGVTVGDRGGQGRAARVGDNVLMGAGSKIIGEISVGRNCIVGANAVVSKNVPDGMVVFGSPCRMKPRTDLPEDAERNSGNIPRVMDLRGTYKGGGGPDKTVLNSAALHDSGRVHVLVTYLRQEEDHEFQISEMAARLGIHYTDVIDGKGIDWTCLWTLRRILQSHRLKVVHAHDDKTLLYGWLLKLFTPGIRIMYTCHSHALHTREDFDSLLDYLKFKVRQKVQIFLMRRYAKPIIAVSEDTGSRLVQNGLSETDVTVLHNGIDVDCWAPGRSRPTLREELGVHEEGLLVGTVARITYEKDLPVFYRVAEEVARRVPGVRFVVVGDGYGDELAQARLQVQRLGLENLVLFTGHRNDLQDVYASFDLFLMTSITEGMPNTLLEAMAMGLAVVSTRVGGIPELVEEGVSGLLAPAGDIQTLSNQVTDLLLDPLRRRQFGSEARRRIENAFNFKLRVQKMEEFYRFFAGNGNRPAIQGMLPVAHEN